MKRTLKTKEKDEDLTKIVGEELDENEELAYRRKLLLKFWRDNGIPTKFAKELTEKDIEPVVI